jgi:hypothetical protein
MQRPGFFMDGNKLSDRLTGRTSEFESENSGSNPLPITIGLLSRIGIGTCLRNKDV